MARASTILTTSPQPCVPAASLATTRLRGKRSACLTKVGLLIIFDIAARMLVQVHVGTAEARDILISSRELCSWSSIRFPCRLAHSVQAPSRQQTLSELTIT